MEKPKSHTPTLERSIWENQTTSLEELKEMYKVALAILEETTGNKYYVKKRKPYLPWSIANAVLYPSSREWFYHRGEWLDLPSLEKKLDNIGGLNGCTDTASLKFAMETGMILTDNGLLDRPEFDSAALSGSYSFLEFILENLEQANDCRRYLNDLYAKTRVNEVDCNHEIAEVKNAIAVLDFVILRRELVRSWLDVHHTRVLLPYLLSAEEIEATLDAQTDIYMEKACWIIAKVCPSRRGGKTRYD